MVKVVKYRSAAIAQRIMVSSLEEKAHDRHDAQRVESVLSHVPNFEGKAPADTKNRSALSTAIASIVQSRSTGEAHARSQVQNTFWHSAHNAYNNSDSQNTDTTKSDMKKSEQRDMMLYNLLRIDEFKKLPRSFQDVILHQISSVPASTFKDQHGISNVLGLKKEEEFRNSLHSYLLKYEAKEMSSTSFTHAEAADRGAGSGSLKFLLRFLAASNHTSDRYAANGSDSSASLANVKNWRNLLEGLRDSNALRDASLSDCRASKLTAAIISEDKLCKKKSDLNHSTMRDRKGNAIGRDKLQRQISSEASNDVIGYSTAPIRFQQSMPTGPPYRGCSHNVQGISTEAWKEH